jgi:hypothetical protein
VELAELLLSIALRIALAATVGLRVFLPLFAALVRRGTAAAST